MRKVGQLDVSYSNDDYMSVFVGVCESESLLEEYMEKDYDLLGDDYIGFELGIDFGINTYNEDFMVRVVNDKSSTDIDEVFKDAERVDRSILKKQYPNGFDQPYNAVVVIGRMKYEGDITEVHLNLAVDRCIKKGSEDLKITYVKICNYNCTLKCIK